MKSFNIMKPKPFAFIIYLLLRKIFRNIFKLFCFPFCKSANQDAWHFKVFITLVWNFYSPFCLPQPLVSLLKLDKYLYLTTRSRHVTLFKRFCIIIHESPNFCLRTEQYHNNNCWQLSKHSVQPASWSWG